MDRAALFLLQAFCAVALLSGSEAIRCYMCTSDHDPRCADPIGKPQEPIQCTEESVKHAARALANALGPSATLGVGAFGERNVYPGGEKSVMACQKLDILVSTSQAQIGRKNVTIRGCVLLSEEPYEHCRRVSQVMQSSLVANTFCGACQAEWCNAASGLSVATLAALAPLALVLALVGRN